MDVVLDGPLLKSPPVKRFCRALSLVQKWRERWFVLKHSGQIPGQFVLEYYTDSTCRKLKGKIDLDQCEQVDSGLPYANPKTIHQHMFNIHTPKRTYFLVAKTELEMNKWVDCICSVCGLKIRVDEEVAQPVDPSSPAPVTTTPSSFTIIPTPAPSTTNLTSVNSESSPYIPISECITGKPLTELISNGNSVINEPTPSPVSLDNNPRTNFLLSSVPPPPPKFPNSPKETNVKILPVPPASTSDEFYDRPKPLHSNNGRTSPEPNLDDMYKVPPAVKRPVKERKQNWDGAFTGDDDSVPLCPPRVNWQTYPQDNGPQSSTYDVPMSNATLYDVPPSHTAAYDVPVSHVEPYDVPVNHKDAYDIPVSNAVVTHFDKSRERLDLDGTDSDTASPLLPPEEISLNDVFAPPRPPKPRNLGDKKKSETDSVNSVQLYDTPASSKGVFLSKQIPADVFAFMKDSKELVDSPTSKRIPLSPLANSHQELGSVDDMYDFPRLRSDSRLAKKVPLQQKMITSSLRRPRQHAYTNAPPGLFSKKETVMNYEYRPSLMNKEPSTPIHAVDGAMALSDETNSPPPLYSPSMAAESTYTNIGGSLDNLLSAPPPVINRDLKPRKKLSDSSDPGFGPFNLAPPPALIPGHAKCSFRKQRAAPSPTPSGSGLSSGIPSIPYRLGQYTDQSSSEDELSSSGGSRRNSNNDDQVKHFLSPPAPYKIKAEIQYLDLDLDNEGSAQSPKSPDRSSNSTVYKTVDFVKTKALNDVKQNVNETYRKNQ